MYNNLHVRIEILQNWTSIKQTPKLCYVLLYVLLKSTHLCLLGPCEDNFYNSLVYKLILSLRKATEFYIL